jgi:hypothetical protein
MVKKVITLKIANLSHSVYYTIGLTFCTVDLVNNRDEIGETLVAVNKEKKKYFSIFFYNTLYYTHLEISVYPYVLT